MRRSLPLLLAVPALAAAAMTLPAEAHSGDDDMGKAKYRADLAPLNVDGKGKVKIEHEGDALVVRVKAKGLDGGVHIAHIHGWADAVAECPSLANDTDQNGFVDLVEGLPSYGPVQVTLSNGLSDTGTELDYERTFTMTDAGASIASLGSLDRYAVVIHGVDLNGDGLANSPDADGQADNNAHNDNEISMPALCGEIEHH